MSRRGAQIGNGAAAESGQYETADAVPAASGKHPQRLRCRGDAPLRRRYRHSPGVGVLLSLA